MLPFECVVDYIAETWKYSARLLKKNPNHFDFARVETLVRFLSEEFNLSRVRNKNLRGLISDRLCKLPSPMCGLLKDTELGALIQQIGTQVQEGDTLRLRVSVADAIALFERGSYVIPLCDWLREVISKAVIDSSQVTIVVGELIVSFLSKGFDIDDIQDVVPSALHPTVVRHENGFHQVKFPSFPFTQPGNGADEATWKAYANRKAAHAETADIKEKLASVVRLYQQPPRQLRCIAQVRGVLVTTHQRLGPVDIYPVERRFILDNDFEKFGRAHGEQRSNVSVLVPAQTFEHGIEIATRQFRVACDILNAWFRSSPAIELAAEEILVADSEGNILQSQALNLNKYYTPYSSLDFDAARANISFWSILERVAQRCTDVQSVEDERLRTALSFLNRGNESEPEDAILYYWIGIDALLTVRGDAPVLKSEGADKTEDLAMSFFPAAAALNERHSRLGALYDRLSNIWINRDIVKSAAFINAIPKELIVHSQIELAPYDRLDLGNLLRNLSSWYDVLPEGAIRDHVSSVRRFFDDVEFARDELDAVVKRTALETSLIYQIRNRLVHHAHPASDTLRLLRMRAAAMLTLAINYATDEKLSFLEAVAITVNIWDRLSNRLKRNVKTDLWSYEGHVRKSERV